MHPLSSLGGERLKISEKSLLGGSDIFILVGAIILLGGGGGNFVGRGHVILK